MAGNEQGKADVGEGRMAASEGANGGDYADEGQDRRGGKILTNCFISLLDFAKVRLGGLEYGKIKFRFDDIHPDSFRSRFYLR